MEGLDKGGRSRMGKLIKIQKTNIHKIDKYVNGYIYMDR